MENIFKSRSREAMYRELCEAAHFCNLCERTLDNPLLFPSSKKILSESNGNIYSKVMFIAEAPGRLGAERTGIPLCGDKTGDNFESLLNDIGWHRNEVFITNAILCAPKKPNGNNDTPSKEEIINCLLYLQMTIDLIKPEIIVTLGIKALEALSYIYFHAYNLRNSVGKKLQWKNILLFPMYHPGPRSLVHRNMESHKRDFKKLAKIVHPIEGIIKVESFNKNQKERYNAFMPNKLHQVVVSILSSLGKVSFFKLTKLIYLTDLMALESFGQTITGEVFLRQKDGPWIPKLKDTIKELNGNEIIIRKVGDKLLLFPGPSPRFSINLVNEHLNIVADVLDKYGTLGEFGIKSAAYRSKPMKYILEQEKMGRNMQKVPVIYKDKISYELGNEILQKRNRRRS